MYYLDAFSGAGKTHVLIDKVAQLIDKGEYVIFCQPTVDLINRTVDSLRARYKLLHCKVIHNETTHTPVADTIEYVLHPYPDPHVLFITHAALERLSMNFKRDNWHIIVDEILAVTKSFEKNLAENFSLITPYFRTASTSDEAYCALVPGNRKRLKEIARNRENDAVTDMFKDLAHTVLSDHWSSFVYKKTHEALVSGAGEGRWLTVLSFLQPTIVQGFKSVTIAGACFQESLLYKYWSKEGVRFDELTDCDLRYKTHPNGPELDISYFVNSYWSKRLAQKKEGAILKAIETAILEEVGGADFLFSQNKSTQKKDYTAFKAVKNAIQLPNAPHGLNDFRHFPTVAYLSARNLTPAHGKFVEQTLGITWDEIHTAIQRQVAYQTVMRGALRDPDNHEPKRVFVPDRATAEWLQKLFPGSRVNKMQAEIDEASFLEKRGRPRLYNSDAERKRASRRRQGLDELNTLKEPLVLDCPTILKLCHNNAISSYSTFVTDFEGSLFNSKKSTVAFKHAMMNSGEFFDFLEDQYNEIKQSEKEHGVLICPSYFNPEGDTKTRRGKRNVVFANGIWLDIENGNLTPDKFAGIFLDLEMVAYSSFNSKTNGLRFKIVIPTDNIISASQYVAIVESILIELRNAGYHDKNDGQGSLLHGVDMGKRHAASLFYLPCQPSHPSPYYCGFFKSFRGDHRKPLDTGLWIEKYVEHELQEVGTFIETPASSGLSPRFNRQTTVDDIPVQSAIQWWREVARTLQEDNHNFFMLGFRLAKAGYDESQISETLAFEAQYANTPKDRIDQIPTIISSVRAYGEIALNQKVKSCYSSTT